MVAPYIDLDIFDLVVDELDNSDLPSPSAGAINIAPEGALDRTNYLRRRLEIMLGESWAARVVLAAQCDHLSWSPFIGQWWCVGGGNTDQYTATTDYGKTWANVSIGGLSTLACYDIAFDLAGNALIANDGSTTGYIFTLSGAAWTSGVVLVGTVHHPRVAYDATSGLFCYVYCDTAHGVRATSTPDRAVFSNQDANIPAGLISASSFDVKLGAGGGRFVAAAKLSTKIQLASVAGASISSAWSGTSITPAAITTLTNCSDPCYSVENGAWLISLYGTIAGSGASEIWKSVDGGLTWTHVISIVSSGLKLASLAAVGLSFYGASLTGDAVVFSNDLGATWYNGGVTVGTASATSSQLAAGGGGLMYIDQGGASVGSRATSVRINAYQSSPLV